MGFLQNIPNGTKCIHIELQNFHTYETSQVAGLGRFQGFLRLGAPN